MEQRALMLLGIANERGDVVLGEQSIGEHFGSWKWEFCYGSGA